MKKMPPILFASMLVVSNHVVAQAKSDTDHLQKEASTQLELAMQKQKEAMMLQEAVGEE